MSCSICIENINDGFSLDCGHIFHNRCITHWLLENETCPVCRKEILEPIKVGSEEVEEPIILIMDTFEDTFAPKNMIESIKLDCQQEINEFIENIDEWSHLEKDEYVLEMTTHKKRKGKYKVKEECRFSINLSIIKHFYCFVIIIDEYNVFSTTKKHIDKYIFKNKNYSRTNIYINKYKL